MYVLLHGMRMSHVPRELCGTEQFIELFVKPISDDIYRETNMMSNYDGCCDFYTRFSKDEPVACYQQMQAPVRDPCMWWTIAEEPKATGRTMEFPRASWTYVLPRLLDGVPARL